MSYKLVNPSLLVRCMTDGTSSTAMLLTGLGPGSDAIIFINIVNIVAAVHHVICYANESYKIWLTVGVWHRCVASFGRSMATPHEVVTALTGP